MQLQKIKPDWNCPVIVAATGPSLDANVALECRKSRLYGDCRVVVVNDAWRLMPWADILYACDAGWWKVHDGVPGFRHGERWSTHEGTKPDDSNYKGDLPKEWRINYVRGRAGNTFSTDQSVVHYGMNSGFQAINLALLKGATKVILVGFDMKRTGGKAHFFGDHPNGLCVSTHYENFIPQFRIAAKDCTVPIVNATPGSALDCWPRVALDDALRDCVLHCDRPVADARADQPSAA